MGVKVAASGPAPTLSLQPREAGDTELRTNPRAEDTLGGEAQPIPRSALEPAGPRPSQDGARTRDDRAPRPLTAHVRPFLDRATRRPRAAS